MPDDGAAAPSGDVTPKPGAEGAAASASAHAPAPAPGAEAAATPAGELASLRAEKEDLLKRLQRVSADYLNYQKRIQKEIQSSREYANTELIRDLLPVLDDIDRALETGSAARPVDDPLLTGLRLIKEKALATLGNHGLAVLESEGKPFDPEHHSAVTQQPSKDHPPHVVLKELRKGYSLKGRTIRPSMVVVSVRPEEPQKKDGAAS